MYTILKIVKVMPLLVCSVFDRIRDFVLGYFPKSIFVKKIEELGTDGLQNKVLSTIWDIDDICWWGDDETESLGEIFPWPDVEVCINEKVVERANHFPCPLCGKKSEHLIWINFRSPDWTWQQECGREGPLSICPDCHFQVAFICKILN